MLDIFIAILVLAFMLSLLVIARLLLKLGEYKRVVDSIFNEELNKQNKEV